MRALCYVQHLNGVGHFVRMHTIAAELAQHHDVVLVDGGFPVPRPPSLAEPRRLRLPAFAPGDDDANRARVQRLTAGAAALRPDVVLIEHYPFSKWELETEIEALIASARDANPSVRIVASLRDIPPRARHLAHAPDYDERVLERLARSFDAVLVHTDVRVVPLEDHFPAADRLPCPWYATGVVVGPMARSVVDGRGCTVATADGPDATPMLLTVVDAFTALDADGHRAAGCLHVFATIDAPASDLAALRSATRRVPTEILVHEFTPGYERYLAGAAVSVSRGGYNALAEVVRQRVPAVVVPDPRTDDQVPRAAAFGRVGACEVVDGPLPEPRVLADAIARAHARERPSPTVDLTGARTTRAILEALVSE